MPFFMGFSIIPEKLKNIFNTLILINSTPKTAFRSSWPALKKIYVMGLFFEKNHL